MINQGASTLATLPLTIETAKKMVAYGKTKKVGVSMENRGGAPAAGRGAAAAPAAGATPPATGAVPLPLRGVAECLQ